MVSIDLTTKSCPFCAEIIQAKAVKCRYCGEFLNTAKARALMEKQDAPEDTETSGQAEGEGDILFAARPSFFGMISMFIKAGILLAIVALVIKFPLEEMINGHLGIRFRTIALIKIAHYRVVIGWVLGVIIVLGVFIKALYLKMTYYEVTADRIEWSRGIFDRKVDNIDMFRIMDLKLRRNILDCLLGIGRITLVTSDKSDPEFTFEKIRKCRYLYDTIKYASLQADLRTGVVHLE
jgi:membrane protein YdbS with pleckstrin-like domain